MCMMGKCVCMMGKCVGGGEGGRYVCLEKRSGVSVVCLGCGCQGGYFWKVMQMLTFMNFRSGT